MGKGFGIDTHLPLFDNAPVMLEEILDGLLNGDDMALGGSG